MVKFITRQHQAEYTKKILGKIHQRISNYIDSKSGSCEVYPAPFAVKLWEDEKTIVEPDISVICDRDKLTDRGCTGAPDWIIEIVSPGNSSHDYIRKLNLYADAGVREYWIVNPMQQSIFVYYLEKDKKAILFQTFDFTFAACYNPLAKFFCFCPSFRMAVPLVFLTNNFHKLFIRHAIAPFRYSR